jgi:Resolvase, N terminal domain
VSTVLMHEHADGKVQGWHRDRLAVVYVRQSSRQQVADHGESTRLQYGLVDRAVALGWPACRVMVIDEDLGRSAANAAERPGFARLVAELTMGHVGLVLGLEMSRLARAGRDWHQLIELCSLAGALLADVDGVYDPNWYNDRLLLGLKGTMTESLCRYRHSDSYADPLVMPTTRRKLRVVACLVFWDRHNRAP